ncbi:hypothetical protein GN956_G17884 [Arapaima gigas]
MLPLRAESDGPPVGVPQMKLTVVRRKLADPKSGCFSKRFVLAKLGKACVTAYGSHPDRNHRLYAEQKHRSIQRVEVGSHPGLALRGNCYVCMLFDGAGL